MYIERLRIVTIKATCPYTMKNEQQTRVELIDKLLLQAGWNVNDPAQVVEEFDILVGLPEPLTRAISSVTMCCLEGMAGQ